MTLVLDCSVALSWAFGDESTPATIAVRRSVERDGAIVPAIWPLELTNGMLVAERRGRLTAGDARRFLGLLTRLPIAVNGVGPREAFDRVFELGRDACLSAYDAAYLDLAIRSRLPLATLDRRLAAAAGERGVEVT